ncbi:MAG: glycine dehydrogenase (aminomethyl-transferring) [Desulfobacterium sp.]|nr:glycine dehydrogenase (aminomethyl-transferring) [Desulfobacterium sp.]
MTETSATRGLIFNEPLLWEIGKKGRIGFSMPEHDVPDAPLDKEFIRKDSELPDLSEVNVIRHFTRLSQWNFGIDAGMYPLGSCTMKYNPKVNERVALLPGFAEAHPLLPTSLSQGILRLMFELERCLAAITSMDAVTLQPSAGAQGELCGMLIFRAYHRKKGKPRSKIIVPNTAHGTNPSSATLCGYKPVGISINEKGILTPDAVAALMDEDTAGIMVTNPNTLGFFEENIQKISEIVHSKGGLVYGDGANMNAVMGIVDMAACGMDILHLNLHKTFSTPHGGGGPGAGPVCTKKYLEPFLPVPRIIEEKGVFSLSNDFPDSIGKLHAFYGNVGIMIRALAYILCMGGENLKKASQLAVLNANYIKEKLKKVLHLPYDRTCMHECVFSDKNQNPTKITTLDMAKRLIDFGFHPPTIYFPLIVKGAMMIEPTETESKEEIDRFIAAMEQIVEEATNQPDLLRNAPMKCKVRRLDEAQAARKPCLAG